MFPSHTQTDEALTLEQLKLWRREDRNKISVEFCSLPVAENPQSLILTDQSDGE